MEASDICNLQEAYLGLYEEESNSMRFPGETRRQFKKHQQRNQELLDAKKKRREDRKRNQNPLFFGIDGKMSKIQREQVELYDIILSHLLDEGYADTLDSAEAILENMSEDWIESIIEGFVDPE